MALYDRLGGFAEPKIPVHAFVGVLQEYALGNMTGAQAQTALALSVPEGNEAAALRDTITAITHADAVVQGVARRLKAVEIERVLFLLEHRAVPLHTVAAVKTRLGVT